MENVNSSTESTESTTSTESTGESTGTEISSDAIAAALAATKSNKGGTPAAATAEKPKRTKLTDEERAARDAQKKAEAEARKAQRKTETEARRAERVATQAGKVAHMAKVNKAAENLPELNESAAVMVDDIMSNFGGSQITAIIANLTHRQRAASTEKALGAKIVEGQTVRIVSAEGASARYVGQLATVLVVQRIRCYVNPVGSPASKRVYLFNSDVVAVADDELETVQSSDGTGESEAAVG